MLCLTVSGSSLVVSPPGSVCASTDYVVLTTVEAQAIGASPMNLTLAEGGAIAGAVIGVWVIGWAIRMAIRVIRDSSSSSSLTDDL